MMYGFIETKAEEFPVEVMCTALEVKPSGYYAWRERPESEREQANRKLLAQIKAVWVLSRKTSWLNRCAIPNCWTGWSASWR